MRYALVEEVSSYVVNIVEWDGDPTTWQAPPGLRAVPAEHGGDIGDREEGGQFERVPPPPPVPTKIETLLEILTASGALSDEDAQKVREAAHDIDHNR